MENLFIVVRHPNNPSNKFANEWDGTNILKSITTTEKVLDICYYYKKFSKNDWVYIYRTKLNRETPQQIICKCKIEKIDKKNKKVYFSSHSLLEMQVPRNANSRTYYFFHTRPQAIKNMPIKNENQACLTKTSQKTFLKLLS